jgi:hypothetical protein
MQGRTWLCRDEFANRLHEGAGPQA